MPGILVVEDDEDILKNILAILYFEGYERQGATDGRQGIERAKAMLPDLVLCDIMMPEADGYTVIRELRLDPRTAHIPVVMMSARGDADSIRLAKDTGAADYLVKPFTMLDLIGVVQRYATASPNGSG